MADQRLPIVNGDDGTWGDILREYLLKEHYDGDADVTPGTSTNGGHKTITIRAGTASAGTAPLKFTSGTLLGTPEAGAIEFYNDALYFTQTTGPTRTQIITNSGTQTLTNKTLASPTISGDIVQAADRPFLISNHTGSAGFAGGLKWQQSGSTRLELFYDTSSNSLSYWNADGTDTGARMVYNREGYMYLGSGSGIDSSTRLKIHDSYSTATSGDIRGLLAEVFIDPSGSATTRAWGMHFVGGTKSGNPQDLTGSDALMGFEGKAQHNGTGTVAGANGGLLYVENTSTGTITNAKSLNLFPMANGNGGTITSAYHLVTHGLPDFTANNQTRVAIDIAASTPNPGLYTGTTAAAVRLSGDNGVRDGILFSNDVTLYRSAADTLKTDDNFIVGAPATSPGSAATVDGTQTLTNKTINAPDNTITNIAVTNLASSTLVTESEGIASNDNDSTLPTSAAVKDYVDNNGGEFEYNVLDYGAVGDGSTDNTSAFQNAINAAEGASLTGVVGTVFVPEGNFVTGPLVLPNRVGIRGMGPGSTHIELKASSTGPVIKNATNARMVVIQDLRINGRKWDSSDANSHGIHLDNSAALDTDPANEIAEWVDGRHYVSNVVIQYTKGSGLVQEGRGGVSASNVQVWDVDGHGFDVEVDSSYTGCDTGSSGLDGFIIRSGGNRFTACKAWYSGSVSTSGETDGCGYGFHIANGNYSASVFTGCEAQDNARAGFYIKNGGRQVFSGCNADSNNTANLGHAGVEMIDSWTSRWDGISWDRDANTYSQLAGVRISGGGANMLNVTVDGIANMAEGSMTTDSDTTGHTVEIVHNTDGSTTRHSETATLTNKTLVSPAIVNDILDENGNEILGLSSTAGATRWMYITNSDNGWHPFLNVEGSGANIDLGLAPKGTGRIYTYQPDGVETELYFDGTASDIDVNLQPKGTGVLKTKNVEVATISGAQTLTDKRVTSRVGTTTSAAEPGLDTDTVDTFKITALATNITSMTTNLTGTPTDRQKLLVSIKDDGTPRTVAWGSAFQASGTVTPLVTTVANMTHHVGFVWDSAINKWVCLACDDVGY